MGVVHFIYIIPSDGIENPTWTNYYINLVTDIQNFYAAQLNNGKCFSVHNPIVEIVKSVHETSWFYAKTNYDLLVAAQTDISNYLGYNYNDRYVCTHGIPTWGNGGAFSTISLFDYTGFYTPEDIALNIVGTKPNNDGSKLLIYHLAGHELGHLFGLPDRYLVYGEPGYYSYMGIADNSWPDSWFYIDDLSTLNANSFFTTNYVHATGTPYYTYVPGKYSPSPSESFASESPSRSPSISVSASISRSPSKSPSVSASASPSSGSESPSISPSTSPSPSASPSVSPSASESRSPSVSPSPSASPSRSPSISPSVSVSISPSRSPSISPSVSPSQPYLTTRYYSRGNYSYLPFGPEDLIFSYSEQDYLDVATENGVTVDQTATTGFSIVQFKENVEENTFCNVRWAGKTTIDPVSNTVVMQIYDYHLSRWETIALNTDSDVDTNFSLEATISDLTNYKDENDVITCRVFQAID